MEGKPLAFIATGAIYWVHADHLGTPQMLTDAAGAVAWDATYRPFGEATVTGALNFNLRFPGQYEDAETGLHYNYFRDYDPSTGRYIQSDPIGLQGGWNTYAYVGGNPMMRVDPMGLEGVYVGAEALWFGGADSPLGGGGGITYVGCCLEDDTRISMVFTKKCTNSIALSVGISAGFVTGLDEVCSFKDYLGWFLETAAGPFNLDFGMGNPKDWNSRTGVNEAGFGVGTGAGVSYCYYELLLGPIATPGGCSCYDGGPQP